MSLKHIAIEKAPKAVGTYSQGVQAGNWYFFSGQIGLNPQSMELVSGFSAQAKQCFQNIQALLDGVNATKRNIVKTTVFLKNMSDFSLVNDAYREFFGEVFPARSCVEVSRLPKDALVEIEIIVYKE